MIEGNFFATLFYEDIEGHPVDHNVTMALKDLESFSNETKILGVYPAHPYSGTFSAGSGQKRESKHRLSKSLKNKRK